MHATVGIFRMDPRYSAEQRRELHDRIVPMVKQQLGFVSGQWSEDPTAHRSYAWLVWQTEEAAARFVGLVREHNTRPNRFGVELESISAVEILAHEQAA